MTFRIIEQKESLQFGEAPCTNIWYYLYVEVVRDDVRSLL